MFCLGYKKGLKWNNATMKLRAHENMIYVLIMDFLYET